MPVKLLGKVAEKSSIGVKWTFRKADGTVPIMRTLAWTLSTLDGVVVNARTAVPVTSPSATETIVLSGSDLALLDQGNDYEMRLLTIEATYDPENGGADLPIRESAEFPIYNLQAIT